MNNLTIQSRGQIFLRLPGKSYKSQRRIGWLAGDTLFVERDPRTHLFRAGGGSYGFCFELVSRTAYKILCVNLPFSQRLVTTKNYLLAHGSFLNFQRKRLEKQIFLKVSEFGLEKALRWEEEQATVQAKQIMQGSLFGEAA